MDDFCAARTSEIPALLWPNFAPPYTCDIGQNVFSADDWMEIELDVDEDDFEAARVAAAEKVKAKARKTRGKKT